MKRAVGENIERVGRSLYGDRWHAALARALGINKTTLWRWLNGTYRIPADIDARLLAVTTATAAAAARAGASISEV